LIRTNGANDEYGKYEIGDRREREREKHQTERYTYKKYAPLT
jgi:hypothetical protein